MAVLRNVILAILIIFVSSSTVDEFGEGLLALGIKPEDILADANGGFILSMR